MALFANVTFGASIVCLNSYRWSRPRPSSHALADPPAAVPDLGRNAPEVLRLHTALHSARAHLKTTRAASSDPEGGRGDSLLSASQALVRATDEYNHAKGLATSRISSRGVAMGYAAGISALVLLLVPLSLLGQSTFSLRCAIAGSGLCWGIGTIRASVPHVSVSPR